MLRCLLLLACFSCYGISTAQKNYFKIAEKEFKKGEWFAAAESYKKAYANSKTPYKPEILFKVGFCYLMLFDHQQAETYFAKAIKAKYADPIAYYYFAYCKKCNGKYIDALVEYEHYRVAVPADKRHEDFLASCESAIRWMNEPTDVLVENLAQVNSKQWDLSPSVKTGNWLFFVSSREDDKKRTVSRITGQLDGQVNFTQLDANGKWSMPLSYGAFTNSLFDETSVFYDGRSGRFYFSRKMPVGKKKASVEKERLFYAHTGEPDGPTLLDFSDASPYNYETPCVASEDMIIFSSDMPGGYGGHDLWSVSWNEKTKSWDDPVNLGPKVNSASNEKFPCLRGDQLYFSSNRDAGMGGYDIYYSHSGDGWGEPQNLKYPLNSPKDDMSIVFNGSTGYLCSNRDGGKGGFDIYRFTKK